MKIVLLNPKTGEQLSMPVTPEQWRVELGRSVVQLAARLGGTAASFVGKKTCALAKEHRQPLLLAAAVVSGVLAVGSVVLWLVCRKK